MNNYHVVTLEHGDPLAEGAQFHHLGTILITEGMERLRAKMLRTGNHTAPPDLEYAEVFSFGEAAPGYEQLIPEWMRVYLPPEEYKQFAKVYFLNEVAYRMYREGGVSFEVAQVISEAELPEGCQPNLRGPYIPKDD
jgi:hypothetical protein